MAQPAGAQKPRSESENWVEPARGLEPLTARLQGGCSVPHLAPTSNYNRIADPMGKAISHHAISFRTTTRTTRGCNGLMFSGEQPNLGSLEWCNGFGVPCMAG